MKNNPFEAHGIQHLSASAINQFITNPASWILKVSGHRGMPNPAMWRGTVIDDTLSKAFDGICRLRKNYIGLLRMLKWSMRNCLLIIMLHIIMI